MNRVDKKFTELKKRGKKALVVFITAGDFGLSTTKRLVLELTKSGADIIELGVPSKNLIGLIEMIDSQEISGKTAKDVLIEMIETKKNAYEIVESKGLSQISDRERIDQIIKNVLSKIDYENTKQLDESTKQIRELIVNSEFPKEMKEEIIEAYETLSFTDYDIKESEALEILEANSKPVFVAVRSSATTEDLAEASFAGQQDTYLNVKGNEDLIKKVKECFASLFTSRATYYRIKKGFKHEQASLAVVVQKMINSDKSGVMFSKDPNCKSDNVVMEAVFGLGEGIEIEVPEGIDTVFVITRFPLQLADS